MAKAINQVLDKARIDARVTGYTRTPQLTRFEIRLGPTTPEAAVFALATEVSAAVHNSETRLVLMKQSTSPLPDVVAIGVEVPHRAPDPLSLGYILREAPNDDSLLAGLGRARDETPAFLKLGESPHFLIGGSGGAFDPVPSIVASLAMRHHPKHLRLVITGRENPFADLPHLVDQAKGDPLTWALAEVEGRYADLAARSCRTTEQFNREVREARKPPPIGALGDTELAHPDVVVVIDELTDLGDDEAITELAREGRAVGVHVIARTSADLERVLSGRLKGYFPARLALPVATAQDSLSILDRKGAESLRLGNGLFLAGWHGVPHEVRLATISDEEIAAIVSHWRG